jgi:hypothetical protein
MTTPTLRLYLDRPGVGVVLGYEEKYVLEALKGLLPSEVSPADYLQKIVTLRVSLPPPTFEALWEFATSLVSALPLHLNEDDCRGLIKWWAGPDLNRRPLPCKGNVQVRTFVL